MLWQPNWLRKEEKDDKIRWEKINRLKLTFWLKWRLNLLYWTVHTKLEVIIIVMFIALFIGIYYDLLVICGLIWTRARACSRAHARNHVKFTNKNKSSIDVLVVMGALHKIHTAPNHDKIKFHCTALSTVNCHYCNIEIGHSHVFQV